VAIMNHTLAFPFGKPTRLMASLRQPRLNASAPQKESVRPRETLEPLSRRLSIPIDNHVNMNDVQSFVRYVQGMRAGETLFVAWQHWFLTFLVTALGFEGLVPTSYPRSCKYEQWTEPAYAMDEEEGDCYDVIWQLVLFRESPTRDWRTDAFAQLHQGFGGSRDSPCASAFHPDSTPTHWTGASAAIAPTKERTGSHHGAPELHDRDVASKVTQAAKGIVNPSVPAAIGHSAKVELTMRHDISLVATAFGVGAILAYSLAKLRLRRERVDALSGFKPLGAVGAPEDLEQHCTEYRRVP